MADPQLILVVDDEPSYRDALSVALQREGFAVDTAADGVEALERFEASRPALVLLDVMLPGIDGFGVASELRQRGWFTPILMLTARGRPEDVLRGFEAGADDYLPKPYSFSELLARVEVLARRRGGRNEDTVYRVADLELDRLSHQVKRGTEEISLQPREFRLLEYLMKHAGQVVTRTMLLEHVWDYHFDPQTNVIDVHISRLRSKIDKGFDRPLLHTIRGAGYMIRDGLR